MSPCPGIVGIPVAGPTRMTLTKTDGTPTFYLNGVMYDDWYELGALLRAVEDAVQAAR